MFHLVIVKLQNRFFFIHSNDALRDAWAFFLPRDAVGGFVVLFAVVGHGFEFSASQRPVFGSCV